MRTLLGIGIGATSMILAYILWQPALGYVLTRVPPDAPSNPRYRNWVAGIETDYYP